VNNPLPCGSYCAAKIEAFGSGDDGAVANENHKE